MVYSLITVIQYICRATEEAFISDIYTTVNKTMNVNGQNKEENEKYIQNHMKNILKMLQNMIFGYYRSETCPQSKNSEILDK